MPLPSNLQTITLTGTYLDSTGAALSGTISFTPPPELVDVATAIMYAAPVTANLDSSGHFSVTLICTDNSTLAPAGWGYTVQEAIKGNRSYTIYVPHTYGSTVDISSLVPLPDLTGAPVPTTVAAVAPGYGALAYNQTWTGNQTFDGTVSFATTPTLPGGTLDPLDWINVKSQGAMGDGATDDTTAIQAALNACPRGGVVYFPAGVYRTSAPLIQQPYTRCIFTHGNGQVQTGGASPYSSIKPLSTFAGAAVWRILDANLGGWAAPTILASPNTASYQVISAEFALEGLSIDGSALVAASVNGIDILGQVQDVYLSDVSVQQVTGNGINSTFNFAVSAGPQAPLCLHFRRVNVQWTTGTGIVLSNATDSTFIDCYVLGCTGYGWWIAWPGNAQFLACRAEWSGSDGFHITAQGGQTIFSGCSTDRNAFNGIYITGTGTTPGVVNLSGCILNRDGRNGGSGGGGYSGLAINNTNSAVVADGITIFPGYDDNGSGTLSPEYGVSATSTPFLALNSGMINAATAAWNDGGGNTTILRGVNIVEGTGQTLGTSIPGVQVTRSGAVVNGTLNVTGAVTLTTALPIAQGGTGQTTGANAFNALSPLTTLGDILAAGASGVDQRVAGNTTATKQYLVQTGNGTVSALPTWAVIAAADLPTATTSAFGAVKLDGTAGDIQPLGVQAAGASGLAADAKHVHAYTSGVLTSPVTVTGVTAATLLFGGPTLAIGTARSGLIYTFELWGALTTTLAAQTLTFSLYWGGVSGTSLVGVGPSQPNSGGTVTSGSWKVKFAVVFGSSTTASATGETALNYFYTSETQAAPVTISNSAAEQLVIGITPSATAVSVTANGGYWHEKG